MTSQEAKILEMIKTLIAQGRSPQELLEKVAAALKSE